MSKILLKANPNNKFLIWLQTRLTNLETTFISLKSQVSQNTSDIEQLKGGGGSTITIDSEFSETSENPLQNKVITLEINHISSDIDELTEKTDKHSTSITNIETWVETAKADLLSIDSRLTEVENITDTNIDDITSIETRVTNLDSALTQKADISDLDSYYTKTEIDNMIGDIETILATVVEV